MNATWLSKELADSSTEDMVVVILYAACLLAIMAAAVTSIL